MGFAIDVVTKAREARVKSLMPGDLFGASRSGAKDGESSVAPGLACTWLVWCYRRGCVLQSILPPSTAWDEYGCALVIYSTTFPETPTKSGLGEAGLKISMFPN